VATFDPTTALAHEDVEFLAFGHDIVDAVAGYVQRREYPARASHRRILTNDVQPASGWLFIYALEFDGVVRSKEVFPVFIGLDGEADAELAGWLLERASRIKREEWRDASAIPPRDTGFEAAVAAAAARSLARLLERQADLAGANRERLEQERAKLERFYEYKERAADEKLASVRVVYDRLLVSDDADEQRILPVWAKNLENAERVVANLAEERERRLAELVGRDQVGVQHELLAASFVEIESDQREAIRERGIVLPRELYERLVGLCRQTTVEELRLLHAAVTERAEKLAQLGERTSFDPHTGIAVAIKLATALERADSLEPVDRSLLRAAVDYYLLIDDEQNDITTPGGFDDDRAVAEAVLRVLPVGTTDG
jgi:hypothetical protein